MASRALDRPMVQCEPMVNQLWSWSPGSPSLPRVRDLVEVAAFMTGSSARYLGLFRELGWLFPPRCTQFSPLSDMTNPSRTS